LFGTALWWWLRSPGYGNIPVATVNDEGEILVSGEMNYDECGGVRPALWLTLPPSP
jgi:hypothetical protein